MSKITGATLSTPMKRPDMAQTDPKKSDYIKNNPLAGVTAADKGKAVVVNEEGKPQVAFLEKIATLGGDLLQIFVGSKAEYDDLDEKNGVFAIITDEDQTEIAEAVAEAKTYADSKSQTAKSEAVAEAKTYTDQEVKKLRQEIPTGDSCDCTGAIEKAKSDAIEEAKAYADQEIAALMGELPSGGTSGGVGDWYSPIVIAFGHGYGESLRVENAPYSFTLKHGAEILVSVLGSWGVEEPLFSPTLEVGDTGPYIIGNGDPSMLKNLRWNAGDILRFHFDEPNSKWLLVENITRHILYPAAWTEFDPDTFEFEEGVTYEISFTWAMAMEYVRLQVHIPYGWNGTFPVASQPHIVIDTGCHAFVRCDMVQNGDGRGYKLKVIEGNSKDNNYNDITQEIKSSMIPGNIWWSLRYRIV